MDEIDNRVISLDVTKLDKTTAATMVKDVSFNEATGIFTITYLNGATITLDTKLEKLAVNFNWNAETQQLIIVLDDGTEQYVDLSALINVYEFLDSDTIAFSVDGAGKVTATIKSGSITEDMLQPNFLADVKAEAARAEAAVELAEDAANLAKSYALGTEDVVRENDSTDNAKSYYEQVKRVAEGIEGAFFPMGTIDFSQLDSVDKESGYMYNIKNEFVTDDRFKDGSGVTYPAGTNVYWTADGYWDCFTGPAVTGVKGSAETDYRRGYVNLTAENVGAVPKSNLIDMIYPVGAIYMSAKNVSPASFLGGTWNQIKDRFLLSSGDSYAAGNTGGEATHTLSTAEMPSHGHSYSGTTGNESTGHTHTFSATTGTVSSDHTHSGTTDFAGEHTHNVYIRKDNTKGGSADRIGNASAFAEAQTTPILPAGSHYHGFSTHGISANHTHGVSGTTSDRSSNHTHSFSGNTGNTGSGSAHNNMPPYLVVYMWQRVA